MKLNVTVYPILQIISNDLMNIMTIYAPAITKTPKLTYNKHLKEYLTTYKD